MSFERPRMPQEMPKDIENSGQTLPKELLEKVRSLITGTEGGPDSEYNYTLAAAEIKNELDRNTDQNSLSNFVQKAEEALAFSEIMTEPDKIVSAVESSIATRGEEIAGFAMSIADSPESRTAQRAKQALESLTQIDGSQSNRVKELLRGSALSEIQEGGKFHDTELQDNMEKVIDQYLA